MKDAVQSFLSEYEQRTGISTRTILSFEKVLVPTTVSGNIYRILQEAMTNVSKHAQASSVFVELQVTKKFVSLTVRDDGIGLPSDALDSGRLGIIGMRERAELLDGTFVVNAQPGSGTELHVTIPLPQTSDS